MNMEAKLALHSRGAPDAGRLLASLPIAIVLLSPGQCIASVNPSAEQFFGQSVRRLTGRALAEVMVFSSHQLSDRLSDCETPVSARDIDAMVTGVGTRRVDLSVAPIAEAPGWQVLTLHDASGESLGDDAGRSEDFLLRGPEILAHEIKNPLAGIRGAAQLVARKLDGKERALTDLIAAEVDRIAKLIDQMQTLSRRTPAALEPCNLHEAARRAIAVLDAAAEAGLRIEEEFDPSLPLVHGAGDSLVQVLLNLLVNAREASAGVTMPRVIMRTRFASGLRLYSGDGSGTVRLPIELRVSDNGPGIDPALREHVFEPFVSTKKTGQGLGLALVRKLVRDMNGRISLERDEAGGWTHFRLHLPLSGTDGRSQQ